MKSGKRIRHFFLGLLAVILCLVIMLLCVVLVMRERGRKELYGAANRAPVLGKVQEEETVDADAVFYKGQYYTYNEDMVTFLVMGIDRMETLPELEDVTDFTQGGQADALFLIVVNPHKEKVNIININRNTMGEVDVYDKDNHYVRTDLLQVCLQHGYGSGLTDSCERQVETISRLFYYLPIHGYVSMEMGAISKLNDSVGGVEVEILENIPMGSRALRKAQGTTVTLLGKDAYWYVKYRDTDVFDSVSLRMARQKQYLKSFIKKAIDETKKNVTYPLNLLEQVSGYVVTDINASKITYMATSYIGYDFELDSIYSLKGETIIGGGGFEEFYADEDALYDLVMELFYEPLQ